MQPVIPYLNFPGTAKKALEHYGRALNGAVETLQHFGEAPPQEGMPPMPADAVMHATFKAGELVLMASDMPAGMQVQAGNNVSLSLNFDSVEELEKVFSGLAEGGQITMPLQDTFWGARFGMLTDAYGINWMFNHDYPVGADKNFPV